MLNKYTYTYYVFYIFTHFALDGGKNFESIKNFQSNTMQQMTAFFSLQYCEHHGHFPYLSVDPILLFHIEIYEAAKVIIILMVVHETLEFKILLFSSVIFFLSTRG